MRIGRHRPTLESTRFPSLVNSYYCCNVTRNNVLCSRAKNRGGIPNIVATRGAKKYNVRVNVRLPCRAFDDRWAGATCRLHNDTVDAAAPCHARGADARFVVSRETVATGWARTGVCVCACACRREPQEDCTASSRPARLGGRTSGTHCCCSMVIFLYARNIIQ